MKQTFKSVYFQGHPAHDSSHRHIRLAFGTKEQDLYEKVKYLSSEEIRQLLGFGEYGGIETFAKENALSFNRACLSLLHRALSRKTSRIKEEGVLYSAFSDPLIATFRGGNGELFHHWYPLIEGFSSRFVDAVLDSYAPQAENVLDPFAGTGATPLTVARRGATGFYCELNPALQIVTDAKTQALQLNGRRRRELIETLREQAFAVPFQLTNCIPDWALKDTYMEVFQGSQFFDEETFVDVLRLRTLANHLEVVSPILGQIFIVAVLASLVPASLMKRAGDLRYKTEKELKQDRVPIRREVAQRLESMAADLEKAEPIDGKMVFLAADARSLGNLPSMGLDCVITSPPYLNGTNYFRNTKLELWFLRALRKTSDLSYWRAHAITGGINDVTRAKCENPYHEQVVNIVKTVAQHAYDNRIPMMIGSYFNELQEVLSSLTRHLRPGSSVVLDIGDSRYAGVHVPTDQLLSDIAKDLGYKQVSQHDLRIRKSHDGGLLREKLLVLEYQGAIRTGFVRNTDIAERTRTEWQIFKTHLPHQADPHRKRNWGHPLHSLCSYQGKMKPSLAHFLVNIFVPEGGAVLDPFAGVGTIPFEASLQGRTAYAFEISPAAFAITLAKLNRPNIEEVNGIVNKLATYVTLEAPTEQEREDVKLIDFNKRLDEFYHPKTLREILLARRFFKEYKKDTAEWSFVLACLLHILHGNRPYALSRRSHPITPFAPTGSFEYRSLVDRLRNKLNRSVEIGYPNEFRPGVAFKQDATLWWPREVDDLDAIVTSPPFFDSTRFYLANWIRLWFCGWEKKDFATQPLRFLELKQKESMRTYESILRQARERLKPSGVVVLHLGKSSKCDMAQQLVEIARPWFDVVDLFEENVTHTESHGITDKGEVTGHQFLVLK